MSIHSWKICKLGGCDDCCDNQDCDGINCEECSLGDTATWQTISQDPLWPIYASAHPRYDFADNYIYGFDNPKRQPDLDDYIDHLETMLKKALQLKHEQLNYAVFPQMVVPHKPINIKVP